FGKDNREIALRVLARKHQSCLGIEDPVRINHEIAVPVGRDIKFVERAVGNRPGDYLLGRSLNRRPSAEGKKDEENPGENRSESLLHNLLLKNFLITTRPVSWRKQRTTMLAITSMELL